MPVGLVSVAAKLFHDDQFDSTSCKATSCAEEHRLTYGSLTAPSSFVDATSTMGRSQRRQAAVDWLGIDFSRNGSAHPAAPSSWPRCWAGPSSSIRTSFQYGAAPPPGGGMMMGGGGGGMHGGGMQGGGMQGGGMQGGQMQGGQMQGGQMQGGQMQGGQMQGGQMQGGQMQGGGYDGGGANPIPYTTEEGKMVMVNGTSESECIESCKNAPQLKNANLGMMGQASGGEMKEIGDCVRFCQTEFEITCFPGDSNVHVRNRGRVALSELRVGDEVLCFVPSASSASSPSPSLRAVPRRVQSDTDNTTGNAEGGNSCDGPVAIDGWRIRFDTVVAWLHWEPDTEAEVMVIHHSLGKVQLTANHLIFVQRRDCDPVKTILAKQVRVGDRLLAPWLDGGVATSEVLEIQRETKRGLFAPLLGSGTIVVDNTLASCYATPENLFFADGSRLSWIVEAAGGWQNLSHLVLQPLMLTATLSSDLLKSRLLSTLRGAASKMAIEAKDAVFKGGSGVAATLVALPRGGALHADEVERIKHCAKHDTIVPSGLPGGMNQYCWVMYILCSGLLT